jgi:hypothetical protein
MNNQKSLSQQTLPGFGWRDVHNALRYVDAGDSFGDWRLATGGAAGSQSRNDSASDDFVLRYGLRYYSCTNCLVHP